jgi:zinc protease
MKHAPLKFACLLALSIAFGSVAHAQNTAKPPAVASPAVAATAVALPSSDQLLDSYEKAIGGREAWMKINSRISKGTIEIPAANITGDVEVHQKAPDKLLSVAVVAGQAFRRGFDGTVAWSDDPMNGLREETGAALASSKREADFYHPMDLRKLYPKLAVTGTEKVGDHDTYVLEATNADGKTDKMYFDAKTSLLVRSQNHRAGPDGDAVYTGDIEDYRDVDGLKLPFVVHQVSDQATFTITFTEIKQNVDLTDDQFLKPTPQ